MPKKIETRPYPQEHACRLRDPGDFQADSFRRMTREHEGKEYSVIIGRLKGEDTATEQAYRYDKDIWTADSAREHCEDHEGNFEAARSKRIVERRFLAVPVTEVRLDGKGKIAGYGAVFDSWTDLGWFQEVIRKGAFMKTIQESDVRCLFNHDPNMILGRNRGGTLALREDDKGLWFEATLPETTYARDLQANLANGNITGCSFMFQVIKDTWAEKYSKRELLEVQLFDVGPVTFPAYAQTSVQARSAHIAKCKALGARTPIIIAPDQHSVLAKPEPLKDDHSSSGEPARIAPQPRKLRTSVRRRHIDIIMKEIS